MKRLATILCLLPTLASAANQVPVGTVPCTTCVTPRPPAVDAHLPSGLREDLAGQLIKMQQLAACDIICHLVIARVLVALDTAVPVKEASSPDAAGH